MRLIDADEVEKQFRRAHLIYENGEENFGYTTLVFGSVIRNAPTIDAVPVVRCKDCKLTFVFKSEIYCREHACETQPDFYCADGKLKESDTE